MNTPYSKPVSSVSSPLTIHVLILSFIVLLISLAGSTLHAQNNSIETNLHDIADLMKAELGKSILTKEESIFAIKNSSNTTYFLGERSFLLTMGIQDTKVYLENEWHRLQAGVISCISFLKYQPPIHRLNRTSYTPK